MNINSNQAPSREGYLTKNNYLGGGVVNESKNERNMSI